MLILKKSLGVWFLAIWFAILQTLSPFVHAHIDGSHSDQDNGLHIHQISLKAFSQNMHHVSANDFALDSHIVVIDKAVLQKVQLSVLTCALVAIYIFYVIQTNSPKLRPQRQVRLKPIYQRTSLNPRAPPSH